MFRTPMKVKLGAIACAGAIGVATVGSGVSSAIGGPSAIGAVQADERGLFTLAFDARARSANNDQGEGLVSFTYPEGGSWFIGKVDCFVQKGNESSFSGTVTGGTYPQRYFHVEVQDNGRGGEPVRDAVRVRVFTTPQKCTNMTHFYPGIVNIGDIAGRAAAAQG